MKNPPSSLKMFSQVSWTSSSVLFWANQDCFHSLFSNGTLLTMENFPWQFTDYGKFFLVSLFPLEKNLSTYQRLFNLPRTCSTVTMEKEFSPEKIIGTGSKVWFLNKLCMKTINVCRWPWITFTLVSRRRLPQGTTASDHF